MANQGEILTTNGNKESGDVLAMLRPRKLPVKERTASVKTQLCLIQQCTLSISGGIRHFVNIIPLQLLTQHISKM